MMRYLLMRAENTANSLSVERRLGESMSEVIIPIGAEGQASSVIRMLSSPWPDRP
jgi:hypothetical protein